MFFNKKFIHIVILLTLNPILTKIKSYYDFFKNIKKIKEKILFKSNR